MNDPRADPEVERQLAASRSKGGSPVDVRERERAVTWLLAHADRAYPVVLARAQAAPVDAPLIELLGRFRRPESTPVLVRAFELGAPTRRYAAAALGASPDPAAERALLDALDGGESSAVVAALAGLGVRADARHCPKILARLQSVDAEIRWIAIHTGARMGCLSEAELSAIARNDADPGVRTLAAELSAKK